MSVRRLAKEQPASFAFSKATKQKADWWIKKYPEGRQQSAVIPVLWLVQKQEGWVSEPAIRAIAELLGMPYIRVLEVATFYTMFMLEPVGTAALIQVCGTTPCMLRGANDLMDVCKKKIGPKQTLSADGRFTWEEVECMGACANAPMAAINDYYFEDLTPENMAQIIDDFAAGKTPKPGSRVGRHTSEPVGGALTLTDPKLYDGSAAKPIKKLPNSEPVKSMSQPDLDTEEGRAAYRAELKAVGRPFRLGGLALILLGAGYVVATRYDALPLIQPLMVVAYGFVATGWVLFLAATVMRTRHHKRRLSEGL